MLADERVDVVHLTTPNHLHHPQVKAVLAAGKHVVCEKPLALTSTESAELLELAEASGLVHCTNYNIRFYPLCHEARARIRRGDLGRVWNAHGRYVQDWLHQSTDWNWRLDPEVGGSLRAVADIGTHWLDLTGWITGRRVQAVLADLFTVHEVRHVPTGPVETLRRRGRRRARRPGHVHRGRRAHPAPLRGREPRPGDDLPGQRRPEEPPLLRDRRLEGRARVGLGPATRSSGSAIATARTSSWRAIPGCSTPRARAVSDLPGGHADGFTDTFKQLYRAVYRAVEAGAMPAEPDFPTFADGHEEILLCDAIAASAETGNWTEVRR